MKATTRVRDNERATSALQVAVLGLTGGHDTSPGQETTLRLTLRTKKPHTHSQNDTLSIGDV